MTVSARLARAAAATALAMTVAVVVPGAAWADPSPAQVRARLVKLNERADQLVERYNQATEAYRKARKKHQTLETELAAKDEQVAGLREELAAIAVHNYQFGPSQGWQRLAFGGPPEAMLSGMAALDQMARDRAAKIRAFEEATRGLRERRDRAGAALEEAEQARDAVRGKQEEVDDLVDQQTKLLRRLGAYQSGNPRSTGIRYTGPASGNAREALQFAFAQVGKPYRYGGTGPASFDCSGLTQAAWRAAGVTLPRTTYTQWAWGAGRRVPLDQVQPGDLLFSKGLGHMGMYAGGGKMVHAPQTGDVIKVVDLDDYWRGRLVGAVRP
ncbi:cell wall-associated NlpC family hydrolase [Nonomuraea thailandensis]|uniref:Cell wall-associated NlpC family hydrolase n=1 Tax=Nonomuraea thailandensis TaxID=1188745 RepID=A0A9X2GGP0_9ACTN|nr:C40 family peptidase [Nonomuraea thailandensis]MCP2357342.1 cell wall-associated NlpC family hydrolase [Nonomuraea thailandensis]